MNERSAAAWSAKRRMGKTAYTARYGIIGIGLTVTVLLTLLEWITQGIEFEWANMTWIIIRLCLFGVIGLIVTMYRWEAKESAYRSYTENAPKKP